MDSSSATNSPVNAKRTSRLVSNDPRFDAPNDLDEKLGAHFNILQEKMEGKSEKEISLFLAAAAKTPGFNEIASDGFLYGILTDIPNAKKHFNNFFQYCMSVNDGWYQALLKMNMVLLEIFYKLKPESRQQILFFFAESIRHNIPKIDNVLTNLLRTVSEGADYKETCVVLQGMAEILVANKDWLRGLKAGGTFAPVALLCFSRFISDQQQFGGGANANGTAGLVGGGGNGTNNGGFKGSMITLCDFLLKERFSDLLLLGRDLVLVLMRLSKITPFVSYWKALLYNPTSLSPKCSGIAQLMATPCANILFSYRVSLHVGRKVEFILKLRSLAQIKYLDWFHKAHLGSVDSGSLRAEIIRYIWNNVHLPELQQQVVIEVRAQFIAWLLKNARLGVEAQWCKLMLFWDWFGFDPQVPNSIQLVEPAFSLVRFLISTVPAQANSLLDYLIRMCSTLHPPLAADFIASVTAAFKALASAGMPVVGVLESSRLDKQIRDALRDTFPDVFPKRSTSGPPLAIPAAGSSLALPHGSCISGPGTSTAGLVNDLQEPGSIIDFEAIRGSNAPNIPIESSTALLETSSPFLNLAIDSSLIAGDSDKKPPPPINSHHLENNNVCSSKSSESHQRGDERPGKEIRDELSKSMIKHKKKFKKKNSSDGEGSGLNSDDLTTSAAFPLPVINKYEQSDKPLSVFLPMVKEEFREHLESLGSSFVANGVADRGNRDDSAAEAMQNFLMAVFDEDDGLDDEQSELIAECLLRIFNKYFKKRKFLPADEVNEETLNELFENIPLYALFRQMSMGGSEGDETRRPLLMILSDMREKCGAIGYLFLYFIRAARRDSADSDTVAFSAYGEMCRYLNKSVESQMVEDLQQCALHDHDLFAYLLPFVFEKLASQPSAFAEMMHLVCAHIDANQLSDLVGEIIRENITLFRKDSFSNLLTNSLNWETVEQMILWHLIRAEGVPIDWMMSVIPRLNYTKHSEAATNILVLMKNLDREPNMILLRMILSRSYNDLFTVHALKVLIDDEDNLNKVAQMMNALVKKLIVSNEIMPTSTSSKSGGTKGAGSASSSSKRTTSLTVHNVFSHLDRFRLNCLTKDSRRAEMLLSSQPLQEIFILSRRENKMSELKSHFSELFAVMEIFSDEANSSTRSHRKNRLRGVADTTSENHGSTSNSNASELKAKRRRIKEENSDDDDR